MSHIHFCCRTTDEIVCGLCVVALLLGSSASSLPPDLASTSLSLLSASTFSRLAPVSAGQESLRQPGQVPARLGAALPMSIQEQISASSYLKASNTEEYDYYSYCAAVSGDTIVVGAFYEDSDATGINGDQHNNLAAGAGAVYVFLRQGSSWNQQAYIKASNTEASDTFGFSVSISGDTLVVGAIGEDSGANQVNGNQASNAAPDSGAAYVYVRSGGAWSQQAYLKASNSQEGDMFGYNVAITGDTIVVGAAYEDSSAAGVGSNQADNSAPDAGAAYVFVRDGDTWSQQAYLKASNPDPDDRFGYSVAVSGDVVVVGGLRESSSATGVNGNQADNSLTQSGAAYVFVRTGTQWMQQAYLKASNTGYADYFGRDVTVSGETIVISADYEDSNATGVDGDQANNSAFDSGAVYVFVRAGTTWSQQAYLKPAYTDINDHFGHSVDLRGDTLLIGATGESSGAAGVGGNQADNSLSSSGAAYLFERTVGSWSQVAYLKASNPDDDDKFGRTVAFDTNVLVVGAQYEDSIATGVNGDQADNSATDAGALYAFRLGSFISLLPLIVR